MMQFITKHTIFLNPVLNKLANFYSRQKCLQVSQNMLSGYDMQGGIEDEMQGGISRQDLNLPDNNAVEVGVTNKCDVKI